jgi:hypothetical protein
MTTSSSRSGPIHPPAAVDRAGVREVGHAGPARVCEDGWGVARAAGQLTLASSGCCAKLEAVGRPMLY